MKVFGQLEDAQLDNKTADPTPAKSGLVVWENTEKLVRVDDGAAIFSLVKAKENSFTLANNQGATAETEWLFDKDDYHAVRIEYDFFRKDAGEERFEKGQILLVYRQIATTWAIIQESNFDVSGVTVTLTTTGSNDAQLNIATDDMSGGSYVGTCRYKAFLTKAFAV